MCTKNTALGGVSQDKYNTWDMSQDKYNTHGHVSR